MPAEPAIEHLIAHPVFTMPSPSYTARIRLLVSRVIAPVPRNLGETALVLSLVAFSACLSLFAFLLYLAWIKCV